MEEHIYYFIDFLLSCNLDFCIPEFDNTQKL